MGIKAQFDFAELYPNNAWQYDAGQANTREWMSDIGELFRDIGLGVGGFSQLLPTSGLKNAIGFKP